MSVNASRLDQLQCLNGRSRRRQEWKSSNNVQGILFFLSIVSGLAFAGEKPCKKPEAARQPTPAAAHSMPEQQKYLGKDYIDSTIMRAIFIINDAASVAGIGFHQKEAIEEANMIADRLAGEAKGDPNERYAKWKINELEWLIYLEEKDLVLQNVKQTQETVDQLIELYNSEVGKRRPDFRSLKRLYARMSVLDGNRADEMARSINNRSRVIARESMIALEKALMQRNLAAANEEFKYCLTNRSSLAFSDEKFAQLEANLSAFARSRDEMPMVRSETARAAALFGQNKIGEARTVMTMANDRLADIRNYLEPGDAQALAGALAQLERAVNQREDSLVRVNMDILKTKGVDAADNYLQKVVLSYGVSREKAGQVDQAILAVSSPSNENSRMNREIDAVAAEQQENRGNDLLEEMRLKAVKKAQIRQDSIRAANEREFKKQHEYVMRVTEEIYSLIEKNRSRVAYDLFSNKKSDLSQYMKPEEYAMLEATLRQVVDTSWEVESEKVSFLIPAAQDKSREPAAAGDANKSKAQNIITEVYGMLEKNDVKSAFARFEKEKNFLRAYLDREAFDILNNAVAYANQNAQ